jgi:hypothetical protein
MTLSSRMMKIWREGTSAKVLFIRFVSSDLCKRPPGSEKNWTFRGSSSLPTCSPLYLNFSYAMIELKTSVCRQWHTRGGFQTPPEIPKFWQSRTGLQIERKMFSIPIPTS